ncbi:MAG: GTPase ObgE [Elusimicrobiota bacterium]
MKFIDKVRIYVQAGQGGRGCLSFLREKYREFGGPNGGNGGGGGGVILRASANVGTLLDFSYRPHLKAVDGGAGKGRNQTGADAEDLVVEVPSGTLVYKDGRLLADLAVSGDRVLAAAGGRGGRGNLSFKSQRVKAPRNYEKGEPGEEAELNLELKLIADIGLAGFPNAGKSTLLARVSNARPKVAAYPFTTLAPHLGLVKHKQKSFILADIPGLIEGAHSGKGLGHDFLRHVERTRVLIHIVDPMGFKKSGAVDGVRRIDEELKGYSKILFKKPRLLAVNKMDLPEGAEAFKKIRARYRRRRVFGISAATGEGVAELLDAALSELARHPKEVVTFEPEPGPRSVKVAAGFRVERLGGGRFRVHGRYVERVAIMSDLRLVESVYRLQTTMRKVGVERALKSAGVREGDSVFIGPLELEWEDIPLARPPVLSKKMQKR